MGVMILLVIVPNITFAFMDTKTILNLKIVDVKEVEGRKSTKMERLGFERGLDELM